MTRRTSPYSYLGDLDRSNQSRRPFCLGLITGIGPGDWGGSGPGPILAVPAAQPEKQKEEPDHPEDEPRNQERHVAAALPRLRGPQPLVAVRDLDRVQVLKLLLHLGGGRVAIARIPLER